MSGRPAPLSTPASYAVGAARFSGRIAGMRTYRFRILNVFAETTFGGNPLCVFEDGTRPGRCRDEVAGAAVQPVRDHLHPAVAVGVRAHAHLHARLRNAFRRASHAGDVPGGARLAGYGRQPEPGNARASCRCRPRETAGRSCAPGGSQPEVRAPALPAPTIAALLGVGEDDLLSEPLRLDTGAHQLVVP